MCGSHTFVKTTKPLSTCADGVGRRVVGRCSRDKTKQNKMDLKIGGDVHFSVTNTLVGGSGGTQGHEQRNFSTRKQSKATRVDLKLAVVTPSIIRI